MPGGLARSVQQALKPRIDVRSLLLRFFSERSTGDYSWTRPNSRYLSQGLYLPALESKALGEVAIMVDTSGSVNEVSLSYARSIVESVIDECRGGEAHRLCLLLRR
jgi:predicted metal-dependent peptidase